jgi:hypothetical protein
MMLYAVLLCELCRGGALTGVGGNSRTVVQQHAWLHIQKRVTELLHDMSTHFLIYT